jgi:hypothetical protein
VTPAEERAQFLALSPFASERDLLGFEQASPDERVAIVRGMTLAGAPLGPDAWAQALRYAQTAGSLLGLATSLGGAVQLAYGLAHL